VCKPGLRRDTEQVKGSPAERHGSTGTAAIRIEGDVDLRRRGTAAVVALAIVAITAGCIGQRATSPTPPQTAVIVAGPDCLADEVLAGIMPGIPPASATPRPAPAAGSVPAGFAPVEVVECRSATGVPRDPAEPATVLEVVLTGDLGPLLAALARPSDPVPADIACPAMYEFKPQIYLVDAAGRAVRPQWPVNACGFLQEGAAATLLGLSEVSSTERVVE
jgi:hypothetical protein